MDLPISDDELQKVISALGFGGDAALYHKLKLVKKIRQTHPESYKKVAREEFGIVI